MYRLVAIAVLVVCVSALSSVAADDKPITVELKSFAFDPANSELLGYQDEQGRLFYYINGAAEATVKVPADGDYTIVINAACDPALNEKAKFKLSIDGKLIDKETTLTSDDPKDYSFTTPLKAGDRMLKIEFTNDVYKENEYDRNLYVHGLKLHPAAKKSEKSKDQK
jgi:Ca-dependent carbohydrate-binding module xylan-binding